MGLIPGLGRSPGVGQATHSSILAWRIPIDKGAWWATVRGATEWGHRHNWAHALAHIKISFYSQVFLFVFVFNYALFFTDLIVFTVYWIKSHWWTSLVGCSPESDTTEWLHFHFSLSCIGEGNGNPLQCSCLENPRDQGAWWAAIYGVAQSWTWLKRLSSSSRCWGWYIVEILDFFLLYQRIFFFLSLWVINLAGLKV